MSESRARRAEQIFAEAAELDAGDRIEFIKRACGDDDAMRREVDALLSAADASEQYFGDLSDRIGAASLLTGDRDEAADRSDLVRSGQRLGAYTLIEPIGRGGMGVVWRAERSDGRFEGQVAIKLLNRAAGGAALERFAREGRYLARLTHPGIARLIDAGVAPDHVPYLVLEHIDGAPIDRYCDGHRLSVRKRIELFLQALDAVAHAHAHLVVHRDIKPSNMLVTHDGTVRLLDFGVAKLLADDETSVAADGAELTRELGVSLTPEFAAPEQLTGADVTTAADVYSLGLLLYVLVAGHHPRRTEPIRSYAELCEAATREPPTLASALAVRGETATLSATAQQRAVSPAELLRTLRSDLDTIVRKALAVEPAERYATVAEFAADLRRYLDHQAVTAQPPTMRYRARKFVRRYRSGVIAAAVVVLALLGSTAMTTHQSVEARRQRDAAVYQQQRVQAANEFMQLLLSEIGPGGRALTLVELLDRGVDMLDRQYGTEPPFMGRMLLMLANGYFSLGETAKMLDLLGRVEQAARSNDDADLLAAALCGAARLRYRDDPAAARAQVEEAAAILAGTTPSTDTFVSCARARAAILEADGNRTRAIETLLEAKASLAGSPVAGVENVLHVSNELSNLYWNERQIAKVAALNDSILRIMSESGRGATLGYVVVSLNRASLLEMMGEVRAGFEIRSALRERIGALEASGAAPPGFITSYGASLIRLGRYEEAARLIDEDIVKSVAAGNQRVAAESRAILGRALVHLERYDEAEARLDSAEAHLRSSVNANERLLAYSALTRTLLLLGRGDGATARAAINAQLAKIGYPERLDAPDLPPTLGVAATVALGTGDARSAERYATDYHDLAARVAGDPARSGYVGQTLLLRARARLELGDSVAARADLERALPPLTSGLGEEHPDTRAARALLRG